MEAEPLFSLQEVGKYVEENGERHLIFQGVTVDVQAGDRIAILGPSGAGKSTLLRMFNRFVTPDEGKIEYRGIPLSSYPLSQLRQEVGYVFQEPYMQVGTVFQNLQLGPQLNQRPFSEREAQQLLEWAGLPSRYLHKDATNLSGGEKQRVSLLRVLANKPKVLLLDEVTSALDVESKHLLEHQLLQLHRAQRLTTLWVTHDLQQARRVAQRIWFLHGQTVIFDGTVQSFFTEDAQQAIQKFLHAGEEDRS